MKNNAPKTAAPPATPTANAPAVPTAAKTENAPAKSAAQTKATSPVTAPTTAPATALREETSAAGRGIYPVYEQFHSWQGEGDFMGRSAYFIRLFGCPIRCEWCDSRGTWDLAEAPREIPRVAASRLAALARESRAEFVVVTGGEPAIHDLAPLAETLNGTLPLHLETSGAFPLRLGVAAETAWVTLSPKRNKPVLRETLLRADEIKLVLTSPTDLPYWHGILRQTFGPKFRARAHSIWLHPEWSRHTDPALLTAINRWILHCSAPYRAGWQLHKCYNVDPPPPTFGNKQ